MGLEIIPVNMDANGMRPERLAHILEERSQMKDKQMPKVIVYVGIGAYLYEFFHLLNSKW